MSCVEPGSPWLRRLTRLGLALTLTACTTSGRGSPPPSPTLRFQGVFSWQIRTTPRRVHRGRPMFFDIVVTAPFGVLSEFDMTEAHYGDGTGTFGHGDYGSGGPQPCPIPGSPSTTAAQVPGGARPLPGRPRPA